MEWNIFESVLARFGTNCVITQKSPLEQGLVNLLDGKLLLWRAFSQSNPFRRIDKMQTGPAPKYSEPAIQLHCPPPLSLSRAESSKIPANPICEWMQKLLVLNWMQNLDNVEERNLQSYGKLIPELLSSQVAARGNWPDSMITTHLAETFKLETICVLILQVKDDDYD